MFDSVNFKIENFQKQDFAHLIENYVCKEPQNFGNKFLVDWQNLRINFYPETKIVNVKNSAHKFFNREIEKNDLGNSDDFTRPNLIRTISLLEEGFSREAKEMKLFGRLEYGINIPTGKLHPYDDIICRYQSIVKNFTNPFYDFYNPKGKVFAKFCPFSNYTVKCYSKGHQMGISKMNVLRYEIANHTLEETRRLFKKADVSVEDLKKKQIWILCLEKLLEIYELIRVIPTGEDGEELYSQMLCYSNSLIRKDFKQNLAKYQNTLKEVHDNYKNSKNNVHSVVKESLDEQYSKLIDCPKPAIKEMKSLIPNT